MNNFIEERVENLHEINEKMLLEYTDKEYIANVSSENALFLRESLELQAKEFKAKLNKIKEENKITGDTSDGYHTFNELYDFRKVFNACLFNEWYKQGKYEVHKSRKHFDGEECFGGGWFIVVAILPTGQISNHYELKDWDLFQCEEVEKAKYEFDGHTPKDVLNRLLEIIKKYE